MSENRPDRYINTSHSTFITLLKLLEALAAVLLVVVFLIRKDEILESVQQTLRWRSLFGTEDIYRSYLNIAMYIIIGNVVLMFLDGVACFLLRTMKKGAAIISICHLIRCVIMSALSAFIVYSIFARPSSTYSLIDDNPILFIGLPYFLTGNLLYMIAGIERVVGMILLAFYHASVVRTMFRVSKELKAGELLYTEEGVFRLGKRATNIGIFIIIGVIIDLISGNSMGTILAAHAIFTEPIYYMFTGYTVVCIIIMAFVIIKFFVVGGCAVEFQASHLGVTTGKKEKKSDKEAAESGAGEADK